MTYHHLFEDTYEIEGSKLSANHKGELARTHVPISFYNRSNAGDLIKRIDEQNKFSKSLGRAIRSHRANATELTQILNQGIIPANPIMLCQEIFTLDTSLEEPQKVSIVTHNMRDITDFTRHDSPVRYAEKIIQEKTDIDGTPVRVIRLIDDKSLPNITLKDLHCFEDSSTKPFAIVIPYLHTGNTGTYPPKVAMDEPTAWTKVGTPDAAETLFSWIESTGRRTINVASRAWDVNNGGTHAYHEGHAYWAAGPYTHVLDLQDTPTIRPAQDSEDISLVTLAGYERTDIRKPLLDRLNESGILSNKTTKWFKRLAGQDLDENN